LIAAVLFLLRTVVGEEWLSHGKDGVVPFPVVVVFEGLCACPDVDVPCTCMVFTQAYVCALPPLPAKKKCRKKNKHHKPKPKMPAFDMREVVVLNAKAIDTIEMVLD
jgi:hypothetical protein